MELKAWLNRGWSVHKKLLIKKAHLESLGSAISNYEPKEIDLSPVQNSSETTMLMWSDLKKDIDELSYQLLKIDRDTDKVLKLCADVNQYMVLYCRYIRRLSWDDVTEVMNYAKSYVFELHRKGIEELDRITCYKEWEE